MMNSRGVTVRIGEDRFRAALNHTLTPATCSWFTSLLPWDQKLIHVRWSGEGCWIPLGDLQVQAPLEEATSYPRPGQFILYPGGASETEILVAYGPTCFASKAGQLAGSPFLTIDSDLERLAAIGREILWSGARAISFELDQ